MKDELTKVEFTITIPVNKQNKQGIIFTKEAVEKAFYNLDNNLPIVSYDEKNNGKVIGTTGESFIVTWDSDNQAYKLTVNGILFNGNPIIRIDEHEGNKILDFRIENIGLTV